MGLWEIYIHTLQNGGNIGLILHFILAGAIFLLFYDPPYDYRDTTYEELSIYELIFTHINILGNWKYNCKYLH